MNRSFPLASLGHMRVFNACLLAFLTWTAPLALVDAASRNDSPSPTANGIVLNKTSGNNTSASDSATAAQEKRSRTAAQKKIDSQLLYALYHKRGEAKAKGVPAVVARVRFDDKGRAIVSIRARVTKSLLAKIESMGGEIISSSQRYNDISAHVPLEKLEKLAALQAVRAIMPAEEAMTNSTLQ